MSTHLNLLLKKLLLIITNPPINSTISPILQRTPSSILLLWHIFQWKMNTPQDLAFKSNHISSIQTHVAGGSSNAIKSFILKITTTPSDKLDFAAACLLFQKNSRAQLPLTPSKTPSPNFIVVVVDVVREQGTSIPRCHF
ncbi:hypothetical protein CEXT_635891 [Caerostris extrusa]|uniref:Uncharacterized protein n=1 Tax=Caerostris extrusa TaxID=172846 RepID=A0AAV4XII7_CAEEX|nr:hypothetical protein CEXT_635891 [Caerostris extrusa]